MSDSQRDRSRSTESLKAELHALELSILDDEFRAAAEEDSADGYWFFLKHVLGYKDLEDDIHYPVCRQLTGGGKKHLMLLPRGHLKSSCVTIGWPMWRAIQDPNRTFAIFNETSELVGEFLREIREHFEENPVLRKYWGHLVPESKGRKVWKSDALQLERDLISRTPTFAAKSIVESTAGRHPDAMVLDDVISNRTVNTPDGITRSLTRFRELQALLEPPTEEQRDQDPVKGTLIVIGTRWHYDDLYSWITDHLSEYYEVMVRRAREDGKCIFPKKFSARYLEELRKTMGEWVFSAQMMNEPVDSEHAIFPPALVRKSLWHGSRASFLESTITNNYLCVDPAFEGDDNFGAIVGAVDATGKRRVLDCRRFANKPERALEACMALIVRWRVHKVYFESVGGQEWLRRELVRMCEEARIKVSIIGVSHKSTNKHVRILGIQPELQFNRLAIHESLEDLRSEMLHYPRGKDDLLDATEIFCRFATRPGGAILAPPPRNSTGTGEYEVARLEKSVISAPGKTRLPWEVFG